MLNETTPANAKRTAYDLKGTLPLRPKGEQ